jgi:hypothetical protein
MFYYFLINFLFFLNQINCVCYKKSYGRGVGVPLSTCNNELVRDGALCYPKCESGYTAAGPVCWEDCEEGFDNHGASCCIYFNLNKLSLISCYLFIFVSVLDY